MPRGASSSRDLYPQLLLVNSLPQAVADTFYTAEQPVPIPRFGGTSTRPFVFEIVRIYWDVFSPTWPAALMTFAFQLSTVTLAGIVADPRVFFQYRYSVNQTVTAAVSTGTSSGSWDFEDGNGHGLVIGTDNIYLGFETTGTGVVTNSVSLRILYRLKTVPSSEYIGILQSQQ